MAGWQRSSICCSLPEWLCGPGTPSESHPRGIARTQVWAITTASPGAWTGAQAQKLGLNLCSGNEILMSQTVVDSFPMPQCLPWTLHLEKSNDSPRSSSFIFTPVSLTQKLLAALTAGHLCHALLQTWPCVFVHTAWALSSLGSGLFFFSLAVQGPGSRVELLCLFTVPWNDLSCGS